MVKVRYVGLVVVLAGCTAVLGIDRDYTLGLGDGGATPDSAVDTGVDAPVALPDGGRDTGVDGGDPCLTGHICAGVCIPGPSCATCASGTRLCTATRLCVPDCDRCGGGGLVVECYRCGDGGAATAEGTCEPAATAGCLAGTYGRCPCSVPAQCPGTAQVCNGSICLACGEVGTNGLACKGGGGKRCRTDEFKCD